LDLKFEKEQIQQRKFRQNIEESLMMIWQKIEQKNNSNLDLTSTDSSTKTRTPKDGLVNRYPNRLGRKNS